MHHAAASDMSRAGAVILVVQDFDSQQLVDGLWKTLVHQQDADAPASTNPAALLVYVGNKVALKSSSLPLCQASLYPGNRQQ